MSSLRRCTRPLAPALLAGLLVIAAAPASAVGYDDAGYLAYADRMQERLDRLWDERRGLYRPGEGGADALINASLLLTHSVAAHAGHRGPTRNDARARSIAKALVSSPVFIERPAAHPPSGSQPHAPGWTSAMHDDQAPQHVMIDAQIVDALVHAWQARRELGLPARTVRLIRDRIHRVARCWFWRWPRIRLNQINWYALVYAADATVTGDPTLLRHDLRAQLTRFITGRRNFGAGLRFQYVPRRPPAAPANVDSAEYANIVLSFLRFYVQARRAGMAPLPPAGRALVRRWIRRAIAGYWTHGGYLNWDTGLGFERWHLGKKYGLAQQALIGIAQTPRLQPGRSWGPWAKWMFDRGLAVYERLPVTETGLPAPVRFGLYSFPQINGRRAAGRQPAPSERRPRGRGRARAHARRGPAAALCLRPRHRAARDHHAHVQHRDHRGQPARVPVRRDRTRAAVRCRPGRRRQHRRARTFRVRAARPHAQRRTRVRVPDGTRARRPEGHPGTADPRPCGHERHRAEPTGPGVRRPLPPTSARVVSSPPGAFEPSPPIASPRRSSTPTGASTASGGARASARTSPSRAGDATPASPRSCATGRASASAPAGRWRWPPSSGSRSRARGAATPSRRCAGREARLRT